LWEKQAERSGWTRHLTDEIVESPPYLSHRRWHAWPSPQDRL